MFRYSGKIKGSYVSMKNGRRAVRFGTRSAFIKKQAALDWEVTACQQIKRPVTPYDGEVALVADFYYDQPRADLDENLLLDMLQVKKPGKPYLGVIKNDNQVKAHDAQWHLDKENPRVEFVLVDMETYKKERGRK